MCISLISLRAIIGQKSYHQTVLRQSGTVRMKEYIYFNLTQFILFSVTFGEFCWFIA